MPENTRFAWVATAGRWALIGTAALLAASIAFIVATDAGLLPDVNKWQTVAQAVFTVAAMVLAAAWLLAAYGVIGLLVDNHAQNAATAGRMERLETLTQDLAESARKLAELASLSDQAKSLIFRDREVEAMREAIHEDLIQQDYKSADALITSLETRPAYADQAARLRQEYNELRKATIEEKLNLVLQRLEAIVQARDFARATREAQRIIRVFPDNQKVARLLEHIETARAKHKSELLAAYGQAVNRNEVDRSIELIRQLDRYLTPQEAAALQDSARGVFRAKLHNLGVQFAIRVTEQQWAEAIATGEEIVRDYPNSRMAYEVRLKMDQLRTKAAQPPPNA